MVVDIETNIETLSQENTRSAKIIISGSDEHLDLILIVLNPLRNLNKKFESFNENLEKSLSNNTDDFLRNSLLPKLKDLALTCATVVGAIKGTDIIDDIINEFEIYLGNFNLLKEFIYDLEHIRLSDNSDFDEILGGL